MTNYEKQTISKETARQVLELFEKNPKWDNCGAYSEKGKVMLYWRKDIQFLEKLFQQ